MCHPCRAGRRRSAPEVLWFGKYVKRYFREHRVPFKEINIERDPDEARDVVKRTGQTGVPVIKIGAGGSSASTGPP